MGNTNRRRGFVDMLSAGTAGTIGINPQIFVVDFNIDIFFNIRNNITGCKRRLTLSCCIKRGNTHKAVYSLFTFQVAIRILTVDLQGNCFNPGLITVKEIQNFRGKSMFFCPSAVHAV